MEGGARAILVRVHMSSQDALWLNMDRPNNLMVIDSLMWFDSPLDLDAVREVLTTRLIDRFDVFSARPVRSGGDLDWEADPDFDLSRHLRVVELGAPGDFDELRDWVGSQRSEVFDRAHPLWSATVVQGSTRRRMPKARRCSCAPTTRWPTGCA